MNKVILMGRLTADPEIARRQKADGDTLIVATYTLAVDRRNAREGQQTADFIRCKAYDKKAEFAEKYLKKGTKIGISGKIQTGSYTNQEGVKVYTTDILVDEHEFCESKGAGNATQAPAPETSPDGFMSIPDGIDEELPFV